VAVVNSQTVNNADQDFTISVPGGEHILEDMNAFLNSLVL
jgi:hypothetical protein